MATQAMSAHKVGVLRLALAGAITASLVFVLCWLGTLVPFSSPTHAYIGLFTPAEMESLPRKPWTLSAAYWVTNSADE